MKRMETVVILLLVVLWTGATKVNAQSFSGVNTPKTNIASIGQLVSAIDERVANFTSTMTSDSIESEEFNSLVKDVENDLVLSSSKSGVELDKIINKLSKIYGKRLSESKPKIAKCSDDKEISESCVGEVLKDANNRMAVNVLGLAIVEHYLGPTLKEIESEDQDIQVRKFIAQKLKDKERSVPKN